MDIKDKNILVLGLAVTGVSAIKFLKNTGANIIAMDSKPKKELKKELKELSDYELEYVLGTEDIDLDKIDLILKSPGIKYNVPILTKAIEKNIKIITDIELAYEFTKSKIIAITGTNGKTTTTTLIGKMFKNANIESEIVGNIGVGILSKIKELDREDIVFILEASSFQLENTYNFKPHISLITNITPDHLNWHDNMENYISSKEKILKNQRENEYTILNYDDKNIRNMKITDKKNIIYFSIQSELDEGFFIKNKNIIYKTMDKENIIMKIDDIKLPGKHNLENILSAISVAKTYGIGDDIIRETVSNFDGVAHRLELVLDKDSIKYYNDSKGTNPEASIKAIEALGIPINLIAGGMDKGGDFDSLIEAFDGRVRNTILIGETANIIKETAKKRGFKNNYIVESMEEAVKKARELARGGEAILLSPACASWDMYENYEERGDIFKKIVLSLEAR